MAAPKVIIVTGANRGIGKAICNLILSRPDLPPLSTLYATSRTGQDLGFESQLPLAQQQQKRLQLKYPRLDVSDPGSIQAFADDVRSSGRQGGGDSDGGIIDVLINNAGVNLDAEYSLTTARRTMDVNYHGTLEMCRAFLPHLRPETGRIVNLSSVASSLRLYSPAIRSRFLDPHLTLAALDDLVQEYLASVKAGSELSEGFPAGGRSYSVSKAAVTALTRMLARDWPGVSVNCCCPGWIDTDMGALVGSQGLRPPKTVEDGAKIPVRLAFGDLGGVSGGYWANDSVRSKGEGKLQEWGG
ncbi:NAD(P)-binding protein [Polychaeton citri CBS 116435]|uniref:NAD(P)-binding protein n=1 Tax=Polychaeton citri CBS 116435 TaxID=1314669 RepID=A0A9P4QEY5_9PEZI|nr:NAD(P)-binding protein [Polychaeton citri CBS 116435]